MSESSAVNVLIVATTGAAGRWEEMLRGSGCRTWRAPVDPTSAARPDVILTDRDSAEGGNLGIAGQGGAGDMDCEEVGVVRIGGEGPADAHLPADVSDRELRLACRLVAQIVQLRRKIRSRSAAHRRLAEQALRDPLTGLPNRRAWDQVLQERLTSGANPGRPLCLAILDLDHFKRVNDAHGHAVGDEVLRVVGESLRESLREDDFVARLGGDEFGLLLRAPDAVTSAAVVERVRTALCLLPAACCLLGATHVVTASAGFALVRAEGADNASTSPALCKSLFAAADGALRQAKRQGRDRTVEAAES